MGVAISEFGGIGRCLSHKAPMKRSQISQVLLLKSSEYHLLNSSNCNHAPLFVRACSFWNTACHAVVNVLLRPNVAPTLFLQFHQRDDARRNEACLGQDSDRLA